MNTSKTITLRFFVGLVFLLLVSSGCESTDSGDSQASANVYYGVGFDDPWYYGPGYYPPDIIVTPPPLTPGSMPHPSHPIATPPPIASVTPRPLPTIPSTPRPAPRR